MSLVHISQIYDRAILSEIDRNRNMAASGVQSYVYKRTAAGINAAEFVSCTSEQAAIDSIRSRFNHCLVNGERLTFLVISDC